MQTKSLHDLPTSSKQAHRIEPNTELPGLRRKAVANGLQTVLGNTFLLMLKTQNYHWNIRGPQFLSIHELTEKSYNELFASVDVIAERIRALGELAKGDINDFKDSSVLAETSETLIAQEMIEDLVMAHEATARLCRHYVGLAAESRDYATEDLLVQRIAVHEKMAWMYRAFLEV